MIPSQKVLRELLTSQEAEEIAWLIVETGIGEELAGQVEHLEFASGEDICNRYPITKLKDYI